MDSGLLAEPVIGPRFARTRWLGPGMTEKANAPPPGCLRRGHRLSLISVPSNEGNGAPGGAGALRYGALVVPGISSEHRHALPERGLRDPIRTGLRDPSRGARGR